MPHDVNEPTQEIRDLCVCPVNWQSISGFGKECPDALELLHYEWVRTIARVSVSVEELKLVETVLFENDLYDGPDEATRRNLEARRPAAEAIYLNEIGRLGRLQFIRPSEHGKHFSSAGPRNASKNISYFYTDWKSDTLANLFWSWFSDMMSVNEIPPRKGPIDFLFEVGGLWNSFCTGRNFRISLDTCAPIGEQNGIQYQHLVIDLDLGACVAHAYPASAPEAEDIMGVAPVRQIKSREY
jgi:hypothetical protein